MAQKHEKRSEDWSQAALTRRYDDLFEAYQVLVNPPSDETSLTPDTIVDDFHLRMDHAQNDMNDEENRLGDGNEDIVRKVERLENEGQQLRNEIEHLRDDNCDIKKGIVHLQQEIDDLEKEIDRLRGEHHGVKSLNDNLDGENNTLRRDNNHLNEENNYLTHYNDELEKESKDLKAQIKTQEELIEEVIIQNDNMSSELKGFHEAQETVIPDQMAIMISHNRDLESRLRKANARSDCGAPSSDKHDLYNHAISPASPTLPPDNESDNSRALNADNTIELTLARSAVADGTDPGQEPSDSSSQSQQSEDKLEECNETVQRLKNAMQNQQNIIDELNQKNEDLEDDLDKTMDRKMKWKTRCRIWEAKHAGLDADWRDKYDSLKRDHHDLNMDYGKCIRASEDAISQVQAGRTGGNNDQCAEKCREWEDKYNTATSQWKLQRVDLEDYFESKYEMLEGENASLKWQIASEESLRDAGEYPTGLSDTCAEKCHEWEGKYNAIAADYDELKNRLNPYDLEHKLEQAIEDRERCANDRDYWRAKYDSLLAQSSSIKERGGLVDMEEKHKQTEKEDDRCESAHTDMIAEQNATSDELQALEQKHAQLEDAYMECDFRCRDAEHICRMLEDRCNELHQHWLEKYRALVARCVESAKEWQIRHDELVAKIRIHSGGKDIRDPPELKDGDHAGTEECRQRCRLWEAKYEEAEEKYESLITEWAALKTQNLNLLDDMIECYRKHGVLCGKFDRLVDAVLSSVRSH
ncbi:hypothetical protein J1614_003381 [Plenodomus biglobosus]|nr:hypothetical protein J1614_003381 [Plenodomus biglobosus]